MTTVRPTLDTEANLRLLVASMPAGALFMLDPAGNVATWNLGAETLTGFSAAEILGQPLDRLYPPEAAAIGKPGRDLRAAAAEGRLEEVEERVRKDGTRFWANILLTPLRDGDALVGYGQLIRDVTRRIDAERKLRASEERLRSLSDIVLGRLSEGIVTVTDSGAIRYVNPAFERLFGCKFDAVRGRNLKTLFAARSHLALDRFFSDVHGYGPGSIDHAPRRFTGLRGEVVFEVTLSLAEAKFAGELLFAGIVRETAVETQATDVRARNVELVGQLAAGIAHEFSNLLTVIIGNADDLGAALDSRPDLKRQADMIRSASERGAELNQRLLAVSRRQAAAPEPLRVNDALRGVRPLLRRGLREEIELRLDLAEGLPPVLVDRGAFETTVLGLVLAAQAHLSTAGRMVITTRAAGVDHPQDGMPVPSLPGVEIALNAAATPGPARDIAPDLGSIAAFAASSRGHVRHTIDADGLTVALVLPAAPEVPAQPPAPAVASAETGPRTGLILVAEDDPFVRSYAVACLESLGYQVVAAVDGRDALARLAQGIRPDVLFTDIVMPGGFNGWELAEKAIEMRPGLKVLYTSGYALETLAERGHIDPGVRVLNKPYRRAELGRHLRELIDEARAQSR